MSFNPQSCIIPEIWCGNSSTPPKTKGKKYIRAGSRYECLKKGIGSGIHQERRKKLPNSSLQQIKYVGETYETNFRGVGISNIPQLIREMKNKTSKEVETLLKRILTKSDGKLDTRAYNSTLLFLYQNGNSGLPSCVVIKS